MTAKKKEMQELKREQIDLNSEIKLLRSENSNKDQQMFVLKEKLHEQNVEVRMNKK